MPVKPLNKESYVDIFRKVLPASYVEPLEAKSDGSGMDLAYAYAAMFAAADKASSQGTQEYFVRPHSDQTDEPASGPRKASGSFILTRAGQIFGEITIWRGQIIEAFRTDSYGDEQVIGRYLVTTTTVLPSASGAPIEIPIEAEYPGWFGNLEAETASLRFKAEGSRRIPAMIANYSGTLAVDYNASLASLDASDDFGNGTELNGRYCTLETAPNVALASDVNIPRLILGVLANHLIADPMPLASDNGKGCFLNVIDWNSLGLVLSQPNAIDGGRGGTLDSRGNDCGCRRLTGEDDTRYADRIESISDVVSPNAIERIVDRVLSPNGIAWQVLETRDPSLLGGFVIGLHPYSFGSLEHLNGTGEVFRVQGAVLLSTATFRRFFVIVVSSTIKNYPYLAGKIWNAINSARLEGVKFTLVSSDAI